jgi:DNA-binding transcriptional MerR regulator
MTWFSNSVAERALTLITEHMRQCEIDKKEIKDALKVQNDESDDKHAQNIARLALLDTKVEDIKDKIQSNYAWIMRVLVTTLIGMIATLAVAVIEMKSPPVPPPVQWHGR